MDASYKLRSFFLKTTKIFRELKQKENIKNERKLIIIKEIKDDLFFMRESAKKMLKEQKINKIQYEKIKQKMKQIEQEIKKIKSDIINL
jgi:hypothetical protein